ncbi:MAG TPA: hypothetical protein VFQ12_11190, partial [Thermoleophilaceae bacterium]|nr:hypothetical protein [Thermoleophilaceae bacterium]
LASALAECCVAGGIGADVDLSPLAAGDRDAALFGEGPGGVVVAGPAEVVAALPGAIQLGRVGGDALAIEGALELPLSALSERFEGAIPAAFA